jgi:hypothetical protein
MRARTTNKTRHGGCEDKSFRKNKRDMSQKQRLTASRSEDVKADRRRFQLRNLIV